MAQGPPGSCHARSIRPLSALASGYRGGVHGRVMAAAEDWAMVGEVGEGCTILRKAGEAWRVAMVMMVGHAAEAKERTGSRNRIFYEGQERRMGETPLLCRHLGTRARILRSFDGHKLRTPSPPRAERRRRGGRGAEQPCEALVLARGRVMRRSMRALPLRAALPRVKARSQLLLFYYKFY